MILIFSEQQYNMTTFETSRSTADRACPQVSPKAAEALAKAQGIPVDQAEAQVLQYQQQYKDAVAQTKEQAKQSADTTGKAVSRGALFGALALVLCDPAAFFAGQASAVTPTVTAAYGSRRT
jgi:hypothetical protein